MKKKLLLSCAFLPFLTGCGANTPSDIAGENNEKQTGNSISAVASEEILAVIPEKCIGCGKCIQIDSEHFSWGSGRKAITISQENLDKTKVQNAIRHCPTDAITLE